MRKDAVISVVVSLVVICVVIAAIFVSLDTKKEDDQAGLEDLQEYMVKFICEDGYSKILEDYYSNGFQNQCKYFVTKYDHLILTMDVEYEKSYLARHYADMVKSYADFYNNYVFNSVIEFDKKRHGNHKIAMGGKFTKQEDIFRLSQAAERYVLDNYDLYMK